MNWVAFSYSLPVKRASSARVSLWRRLQRLGAVTPKAGVYVLPAQDDCVEAFLWLSQEVQEMGGDAVVMRVDRFEGLPDAKLKGLFQQACRDKYGEIEKAATGLEKAVRSRKPSIDRGESLSQLERLRKRHAEIAEIDFFNSPDGVKAGALLRSLDERLRPGDTRVPSLVPMNIADYRQARWVTRPRPHVDRLACAWLIRRFINQAAEIRYATRPEPGEIGFDTRDAVFGHRGNHCTFETMIAAFNLKESELQEIAEIVHEIDLRDGRYARPETAGIALVLKGWLTESFSDAEIEHRGIALFEGLFTALSRVGRSEKVR
ncbi:MAG: chromate resistance protein [Nitrospira sp.]|nr:chromate resistance protein [Nitrospira sp.]